MTIRMVATMAWGSATLVIAAPLSGQAPAPAPRDTSFLLSTDDAGRTPSPFIGNGRIGIVIPALGIGPSFSFMSGLYENAPSDIPRIVAIPAWNALQVSNGSRWLDTAAIQKGEVDAYRQVLDMSTGTVRTSYHWVNSGRRMSVRVQAFASRADPDLVALRLDLAPQYTGRLGVRFAIQGQPAPKRLALATLEKADPAWQPGDIWYPGKMIVRSRQATPVSDGARLSMSSVAEGRPSLLAQAMEVRWPRALANFKVRTIASGDTALVEVTFDATRGRNYTFVQVTSARAAQADRELVSQTAASAQGASTRGFRALAQANAQAWHRRWETDIQVEGNPALQRVIRSMLFYLLCSADSGTRMGIPPMGLSSGGYYGHVFWDSDTWMFPTLLATHPDIAHSLVAFRARTVPAAQENARRNGFRGAMYPWEADELGVETTPHFAAQNASSEIHVNGDVALAQWQYYQLTGDTDWLAREGFSVIRETANFWASRASYDSTDKQYHIRNVVSVSEGLVGVNDDAYTNAVARKNLEIAAQASSLLKKPGDPRWREIAGKLHLPYDSTSEFFRTYEGAPDSTLGDVTPMLSYPLGVPMSGRAKRSQLEQAVKSLLSEGPGAMMGATLLSVDAAELGDRALLDSLLPHSYRSWIQGPFLMLSETPDKKDAVDFLTGAGGFLQQVIYGWTGLRIGDKGLEPAYPPLLPTRVKRLTLRNIYSRGKRYDVLVDSAGRRMTKHQAGVAR
jgi:trehalose/maltose hydrolase-like predicted phosphorylase